jgi:fumarate hydratase class II
MTLLYSCYRVGLQSLRLYSLEPASFMMPGDIGLKSRRLLNAVSHSVWNKEHFGASPLFCLILIG